jgi:hypothetical protein
VAADHWGVPLVLWLSGAAFGASALFLLAALRLWQRYQPKVIPAEVAAGL